MIVLSIAVTGCKKSQKIQSMNKEIKIIFLHHSTGKVIWQGKTQKIVKVYQKIRKKLFKSTSKNCLIPRLMKQYNKANRTNYNISEVSFPKKEPYGWHNYPYDYYNIWVKNQGGEPYLFEPTLEMLTKEYDVIIFKHCFPVCNIEEDASKAIIDSDYKSIENYKLQYNALKGKLYQFPDIKFIVWTGAALVKNHISEESAMRAREFFTWVKEEWDQADDNIFIWDFYELQTEGGLYFKDDYAVSSDNSHPSPDFAKEVAPLLVNRIIDVIENNGTQTDLNGHSK